jgi:hypothetical protein
MTLKTKRYETNPFISSMAVQVGSKSVQIQALGSSNNILVNQSTGEVTGTHVIATKRVDKTKFVKTFADYMSFTFDLTRAGNKALRVVMWALQEQSINKDTVILDKYTLNSFLAQHLEPPLELSYPTFTRGLGELGRAKIIAKTIRTGMYFINPNCMFNGDRIAFTTVIERESTEQKKLDL